MKWHVWITMWLICRDHPFEFNHHITIHVKIWYGHGTATSSIYIPTCSQKEARLVWRTSNPNRSDMHWTQIGLIPAQNCPICFIFEHTASIFIRTALIFIRIKCVQIIMQWQLWTNIGPIWIRYPSNAPPFGSKTKKK